MKGPSVLEVCLREGGVLKGTRVATYIAQWALCAHELGHEPGMEEFIAWWREPRRTVYRQQREFREVFPSLQTPQVFVDLVGDLGGDRAAAIASLSKVPVPA